MSSLRGISENNFSFLVSFLSGFWGERHLPVRSNEERQMNLWGREKESTDQTDGQKGKAVGEKLVSTTLYSGKNLKKLKICQSQTRKRRRTQRERKNDTEDGCRQCFWKESMERQSNWRKHLKKIQTKHTIWWRNDCSVGIYYVRLILSSVLKIQSRHWVRMLWDSNNIFEGNKTN